MSKRVFNRVVEFDEKSRQYPIRELVAGKAPRSYTWPINVYLDQGQEGACVGFSWAHELAARPVVIPDVTPGLARVIYNNAKKLDDYPGENYEGTSVLAGAKAVIQSGYMQEYRWAFGIDDLIQAVGYTGPGVLGINWYEGMEDIDKRGFVHATGSVVGGHAILLRGVNVKKQYVTLHNSWGRDWGIGGDCYVSFADLDKLLKDSGEFCIPVGRKKI